MKKHEREKTHMIILEQVNKKKNLKAFIYIRYRCILLFVLVCNSCLRTRIVNCSGALMLALIIKHRTLI